MIESCRRLKISPMGPVAGEHQTFLYLPNIARGAGARYGHRSPPRTTSPSIFRDCWSGAGLIEQLQQELRIENNQRVGFSPVSEGKSPCCACVRSIPPKSDRIDARKLAELLKVAQLPPQSRGAGPPTACIFNFRLCTRIPVMVSPHDDELPAPFVEYPGAAKSLLLSSWVHLDRTKKRYFFFTSSSASNG